MRMMDIFRPSQIVKRFFQVQLHASLNSIGYVKFDLQIRFTSLFLSCRFPFRIFVNDMHLKLSILRSGYQIKTVGVLKLENSKQCVAVGWLRSICLATILLFLIL